MPQHAPTGWLSRALDCRNYALYARRTTLLTLLVLLAYATPHAQMSIVGPGTTSVSWPSAVVDQGGQLFNVKAYGAVGNGTTDDTPFFQAAIAALLGTTTQSGTIFVPRGSYKILSTLNFFTNAQVSISLIGEALDGTELLWMGSASGTMVQFGRNRGMRIQDIRLRNGLGAVGTTTGLLLAGDVAGTNNSAGLVQQVRVQGFQQCVVIGDTATHAVSEISFNMLNVNLCTTGITINDGQSVDFWFYGLGMASNTTGLLINSPAGASTFVLGGSASTNTEDFAIRGGSNFQVQNFRSENAGRFMTVGTDSPGGDGNTISIASVINCTIGNTINADNRAIRLHRGGKYTIRDNLIVDGWLYLKTGVNARAFVSVQNNHFASGQMWENGDVSSALTLIDQWGNHSGATTHFDNKLYYWRDNATILDFIKLDTSTNIGATPVQISKLALGTAASTTLTNGALGMQKITASGTAPGAGSCKFEVVAGTTGGTCKLQMLCGTSTTAVTVLDNVGTGC